MITQAMIEAGVYAAREHPLGGKLEDLVWSVFLAMDAERRDSEPESSSPTTWACSDGIVYPIETFTIPYSEWRQISGLRK